VPFRDPEKQKAAVRESAARRRASSPSRTLPALAELQLKTAQDALEILRDELGRVRGIVASDPTVVMSRARTVSGLLLAWLRGYETAEIAQRLEALETRAQGGRAA
jgi:hypothetical protein